MIARTRIYPFFTFLSSLNLFFSYQFLLASHMIHQAHLPQSRHSGASVACAAPSTLAMKSPLDLLDSSDKEGKWQNKRIWYFSQRCLPNVSCTRKNIVQETQSNPSPVAIVNFLDDWKSVTCTWTFLVAQSVGIILAEGKTKQVPADCSRKADSQT